MKTFFNLNKTVHVHKGFLYVSPFKLDLSQVFFPGHHGGGGVIRAPYLLLFFHLSRQKSRVFFSTREALPGCGGIQEKRKRCQHHYYGIMEHNISYLDAKIEISCSLIPPPPFSPLIWRPWRFLPWTSCLRLKLHGAPLVILIYLSHFLFSFLSPLSPFFSFLLSLSFFFLFGALMVTPGARAPKAPQDTSLY